MHRSQTITRSDDGSLTVVDGIHGTVRITEDVLIRLIYSPAVQRLGGVLQHGITGLLAMTPPVTRLEHSVGAMLLVRKLGASLKEQIASLLHDISHTALSHVVDHAFRGTESYHELQKESYLLSTELPELLKSFGYDWRDFLKEEDYPLLEQDSPKLCADRLDYGLRDCLAFDKLSESEVQRTLENLRVAENCIVCSDPQVARVLAEAYMATDRDVYGNPEHIGLYELAGAVIKDAVDRGYITKEHLWLQDTEFWSILSAIPNEELSTRIGLIVPTTRFQEVVDGSHDLSFRPKVRTIDPGVVRDGVTVPLSTIDPTYKRIREEYLASKTRELKMRVIS
ncbi:uncharacterized protein SPPG_07276 [Spizellomyces punctatus DAOM BR117]|uniref:HD/PDEase domain-containing protein n=1 Tax=Spizellomyces punctatus (strain DAOM BR117) TaxID=645134 RepID=A0A0L0H9M0_SPIPD|nr:uncharacterized protein SPPG_07276 [Spizellomyces punctatus DAOM BR117]KNC97348.1 hypothetical protein SPPG_07276 [Spizellomyces punctatus DAOM BR117]|eukprot:XP_016605388.1 hypothetical protein SPPG_07276 [Spizellomyces punctatus DAOM BR117]